MLSEFHWELCWRRTLRINIRKRCNRLPVLALMISTILLRKCKKENSASQILMMCKAVFPIKWFAKSNKKISAHTLQAQNDFYEMNIRFPKKSFMYLTSLTNIVNTCRSKPRKYPLLIGCGEYDIPMELSAIELLKKNEPECSVVIFQKAGHCINMDAPNEFNAVMEKFWENGHISRKRVLNSN